MDGESRDFLTLNDQELLAQCEVDCYRASGPGGQKRNKTSSAVRLRHRPTGLSAISNEDRSQHTNKARAVRRLRRTMALRIRFEIDPETYVPSDRLRECVAGGGKLAINQRNPRYALVVREVLDVLVACALRVRDAANRLDLSTAQLMAFLKKDPHVWREVNRLRAAAQMKPLR